MDNGLFLNEGILETLAIFGVAVDSKELEYGPWTISGGVAAPAGFGVGGQSYSTFKVSPRRSTQKESRLQGRSSQGSSA